jgi:hypothetical protein
VPPPGPDPIRLGEILLGKYRVEGILGRGGMGIVVLARHLTLDDRVAIKFLLPDLLGEDELVQRFLREARAAVRIRSQHIARVSDVGRMESGAPYIVMEYLEGKNLSAVIAEDGPLALDLAVDLVLQASEALAEAHAQQIVHRDVKPSNLFLARHADGSPCMKVLDFGISKMPGGQDHALTRTGAIFGSPLYMSPEQLRSARDVDARSDIYSLGVVLYELVTGQVPFRGDDLPQLVYKIMSEPPIAPRTLRPEVPVALERAILAAMARDREHRFQTVADLAFALAPVASVRARGSAERIGGILRAVRTERLEADRLRGVIPDPEGQPRAAGLPGAGREVDSTAPLVDPNTVKGDVHPSIASFGATRGAASSIRSPAARWAARVVPIALGVVAIGLGTRALRSSRHADLPASSEGPTFAVPVEAPPAETPSASSLPTVASATPPPTRTAPAGAEPSSAPSHAHNVTAHAAPDAATPPVPPARSRRPEKDPFKRDVF